MSRLINNIAWLLPAAVALVVLGFVAWQFAQPTPSQPVTGDYAAGVELAQDSGATLLIAVDNAPP